MKCCEYGPRSVSYQQKISRTFLTDNVKYNMQIKTKIVSTHTADSKPVKQEVNGTVILPHLVFSGCSLIVRSG